MTTLTDDAAIDLLRDKLKEGDFAITINNTPFGKQPEITKKSGENFALDADENAALNAFVDRYADTLIELDKVDVSSDGIERAWEIGSILSEAEELGEDFNRAELIEFLHIEGVSEIQAQRFLKLYAMFPEGHYENEHTYSQVTELALRAESTDHARETYDRMVEAGFTLTNAEARAWGDVEEPTLDEIATNIVKRVNTSLETQVRGVKRLFTVYGVPEDDQPGEAAIQDALEAVDD